MTKRQHTKIVREGNYLAEVNIELIETGEGWSPYLSLEDVQKLDEIREALRNEDIKTAALKAKVFVLRPAAV
jgi:hypothetical protein